MSVPLQFGRRSIGQTLQLCSRKTAPLSKSVLPPFSLAVSSSSPWNRWTDSNRSSVDGPSRRSFSNTPRNSNAPTDLMDYPHLVPTLFDSAIGYFRNRFFEAYVQRRYDAEFNQEEFITGAKRALLVVSDILSSDDVTPLLTEGLVDSVAFNEIKANHDRMDVARRRRFRIDEKHLKHVHLHQIGIIEDDNSGHKAVEIMMVFAVMDVEDVQGRTPQDIMDSVMLCNYRFHRDFNNDRGWVLNVVNQFRIKDDLEMKR